MAIKNKINFQKGESPGPAPVKSLTLEEKKQLFHDIYTHKESNGEESRTHFRFKWQTPLGLTLSGVGFGYLVNERFRETEFFIKSGNKR